MTITTLTTSGACCRIHSYGATVLSFRTAEGRDNIFLSQTAIMDGSKAIRGGIPLVFPVFGPSAKPSTMPQHGFARVNTWKLVETTAENGFAEATYSLNLADTVAGRGENNPWSIEQAKKDGTDCRLTYVVRLEAQQLTTTLTVHNTGTSSFEMEALLHTYYAVQAPYDSTKTFVSGLGGYSITDKVTKENDRVQFPADNVVFGEVGQETDQDYHPPVETPPKQLQVMVADGTTYLSLEASGKQISGEETTLLPVSCVVWNPGNEKAATMSDLHDHAQEQMICVEPGILAHNKPTLQPGQQVILSQTIRLAFP